MILTTKQKLLIPLKYLPCKLGLSSSRETDWSSIRQRNFGFRWRDGSISLPLAKQAKSVTLIDISEKMLEQARLKAEQQEIKNIQFWSKIYWQIPGARIWTHCCLSGSSPYAWFGCGSLNCFINIWRKMDNSYLLILLRQKLTIMDLNWLNWKTS